ncbi:MAG: hypothetical protein JWR54_1051 [Mucilaginibacter sp.]|nr:hypothetical protein [Mucilaginibacter sp.]
MGIFSKEILTVAEYLANDRLNIPAYQRPYKWSVRNVIQLMDDIEHFRGDIPYRIGTIVVFKEKDDYLIVDGQQRTLTFLLMLKAIMTQCYDRLTDNELKGSLVTLQSRVFQPTFTSDVSKQNIQANYQEIERRLALASDDYIRFFLSCCQITYFVIDDISEAFQFFDAQNARGKDLEPHDLLKAYHLREIDRATRKIPELSLVQLVEDWEGMNTEQLSGLFSNFLYRVRGWSNGISSRYFTKKDVRLFKGVNLESDRSYPYVQLYQLTADHVRETPEQVFPFQLDQLIINGKYFFEMIAYYHQLYNRLGQQLGALDPIAINIVKILNNYDGRHRTGDKYVRMLFNCAILYYIDRFGERGLTEAIKKIFIWAYSLRLTYQVLQLASVDNYVTKEFNIFSRIRNAIHSDDIITLELPQISLENKPAKTQAIEKLFQQMKYVGSS